LDDATVVVINTSQPGAVRSVLHPEPSTSRWNPDTATGAS
jgi:hypothetical protein